MITNKELYEVIKRDVPEIKTDAIRFFSVVNFDLDLNLDSVKVKIQIEAVEITTDYAGIYYSSKFKCSSKFKSAVRPLDAGLAKLFKKRPVFIIYQQLFIYGIPTVWEIKLFFNFTDDLRSVSLRFKNSLVGDPNEKKKLRKELPTTEEFHSLIYAYLFKKTPLEILQDYIQSNVL